MINATKEYLKKFLNGIITKGRVLDVGSKDVNGHIKSELEGWNYTGVDMEFGPNVDSVVNGHRLAEIYGEEFDLIVCFDTLEHDDRFWLTIEAMRKVLKHGGWLVIGTPSINHGIHKYPLDFYRFTEDSYRYIFFEGMKNVHIDTLCFGDNGPEKPDQIYGYAQKV
jgi:2-polyprenyl-3-methyl-5-hydroxy-6-metoxy-1,4-benzoquinol methylase